MVKLNIGCRFKGRCNYRLYYLGAFTIYQQPHFGLQNWHIQDAPFHSGWYGFISVFLFAGFSFQGTELIELLQEKLRIQKLVFLSLLNWYFGA